MIERIQNNKYMMAEPIRPMPQNRVRGPENEFAEYFVAALLSQAMPAEGMMGGVSGYEYEAYKDVFTREIAGMMEESLGFSDMIKESTDKFRARSQENRWP